MNVRCDGAIDVRSLSQDLQPSSCHRFVVLLSHSVRFGLRQEKRSYHIELQPVETLVRHSGEKVIQHGFMVKPAFGFAAIITTVMAIPQQGSGVASVERLVRKCSRRIPLQQSSIHAGAALLVRGGATETPDTLTLAGKLFPFLSNFALSKSDRVNIYQALVQAVDLREMVLIASFAWAITPFFHLVYNIWIQATVKKNKNDSSTKIKDFDQTQLYKSATQLSQAATVGALIYLMDCIAVILHSMGFHYFDQVGFSHKASNLAFFAWVTTRVMHYKGVLINRSCQKAKSQEIGKARMYNRLIDTLLIVVTSIIIIERLNLDFGISLKSLFALGGVGSLVMSLASKDLAGQLVNGFAVTASERFSVGDKIKLGDGTTGNVQRIGLLYTEIRGSDEIVVKIPNSQIANQRTSNISRLDKCQVKQTLRFTYEDINKLPSVMASIEEEIIKACPALITDGSRPFRVHWREYEADHLAVVVDCHFNIPPRGTVYYDNRQAVLEAIARAATKHNVQFAIPSSLSKNLELGNNSPSRTFSDSKTR